VIQSLILEIAADRYMTAWDGQGEEEGDASLSPVQAQARVE
jgi:hypothetical protein